MVECLLTNEVVVGLNPVAVTFTYLFWKLPGYSIPYSPTQADYIEDGKHFANICKR